MSVVEGPPCPVCRDPLVAGDKVFCTSCLTPHHRACWEYSGGCSVYGCGQPRFALVARASAGILELSSGDPTGVTPRPRKLPAVLRTSAVAPLKRLICFDRLPRTQAFLEALSVAALIGLATRILVGLIWWLMHEPAYLLHALPLPAVALVAFWWSRQLAWHFACEASGRRVLESWSSPFGARVRQVCTFDDVESVVVESTGDHPTIMEESTVRVSLKLKGRSAPVPMTDTAIPGSQRQGLAGRARRLAALMEVPCVETRRREPHPARFWPTFLAIAVVLAIVPLPAWEVGLVLPLLAAFLAALVHQTLVFGHRKDRPDRHIGFMVGGFFLYFFLGFPLLTTLIESCRVQIPAVIYAPLLMLGWFWCCRVGSDWILDHRREPDPLKLGPPDRRDPPGRPASSIDRVE